MAAELTRRATPLLLIYGLVLAVLGLTLLVGRLTPLYALSFITASLSNSLYFRDMPHQRTVSFGLPNYVTQLAIAPNGRHVAFVETRDGIYGLMMSEIPSGRRSVAYPISEGTVGYLTWSPDSRMIAYRHDILGENRLMIFDVAERRARQVTDVWRCRALAWSSDSGQLACNAYLPGSPQSDQVLLFDSRAGHEGEFTAIPDVQPHMISSITWSPNGDQIVFSRVAERTPPQLIRYNLHDGTWQPLSHDEEILETPLPAFSPDGQYIVYTSRQQGSRTPAMRLMTVDGQYIRTFDFLPITQAYMTVEWSPDSRFIAARAWVIAGDTLSGLVIVDVHTGRVSDVILDSFAYSLGWMSEGGGL